MDDALQVGVIPGAVMADLTAVVACEQVQPARPLSFESSSDPSGIVPFLKWAGGKRWLASHMRSVIGAIRGRYIEPFVGSGAVFFAVQPSSALLSDSNRELIYTYRAIKSQWRAVGRHLAGHHALHCKEHYYSVRRSTPSTFAARAAKFIYLNRTCWNGLYRVNLNGQFNVPIGTKTAVIMDSDDFGAIAAILSNAEIIHADYEYSISQAVAGDVVFCDPPYTVRHKHNGFIKYNEDLFSWADQVRLRNLLLMARNRGVRVFVTNADHQSIRELYSAQFDIHEFERFSSIGGARAIRGSYPELLIVG
ncbi:DNA adenine methylase [Rubrivivax sp. A210]|uniref:DNA adenine methylase n=1 Tax=Rubrivivax sp. A210 TaxID=2772301 RepID=UPI001F29CAFE|nr:Dam family site-specific DNA-(adenine-N6)-methyltransferase [Rubrivivax sp. A210]